MKVSVHYNTRQGKSTLKIIKSSLDVVLVKFPETSASLNMNTLQPYWPGGEGDPFHSARVTIF